MQEGLAHTGAAKAWKAESDSYTKAIEVQSRAPGHHCTQTFLSSGWCCQDACTLSQDAISAYHYGRLTTHIAALNSPHVCISTTAHVWMMLLLWA